MLPGKLTHLGEETMNEPMELKDNELRDLRAERLQSGAETIDHDLFTEQISLWLDDELSPAEWTRLQAHLELCPACRQTYRAMQQIDSLFRQAASLVAAPLPGFSQRLEVRLAHYRPASRGGMVLGLSTLLLGSLFLFVFGVVLAGALLLNSGLLLLDIGLFYNGLENLIEFLNGLAGWLDLGNLFVKASLMAMSQPLFWVCTLAGLAAAWLWLRVLNSIYRRPSAAVELLI